jgi:translation initiation factor 3 subunit G
MAETSQMSSRWADEIDDDEYGTDISVQPSQEVTVKDGERIVAEIKVDPDTGKKTKIIRTFKLEKKFVSKGVIDRKRLTKYGQSKRDPPGPNSATTVVADEVLMQFLTKDQDAIPEVDPLAKLNEPKFVKCRYCQENHFTAKCPFKDSGLPPESINTKDMEEPKKVDSETKPGIFVPPALRGGNRRGETMGSAQKKDEYTIRVSNLPESMSETDMQELCNPFGKTDRIFLAKDRTSGVCKGFAFVTYQTKENAARALQSLNGYGYDHLILNVEWSKPANN